MIRWLTIQDTNAFKSLGLERASAEAHDRAAKLAGGHPFRLGSLFRDGVDWSIATLWIPVVIDAAGQDERPPFQLPPGALWGGPDSTSDPNTMCDAGELSLARGEWERGWRLLQWRFFAKFWHRKAFNPMPIPCWDGSALDGRKLLIWREQGWGDAFSFARYVPLVTGGAVSFWAGPIIGGVMRSLRWGGELLTGEFGDIEFRSFDVHLPLMSLPLMLGKYEPWAAPAYLFAEESKIQRWAARLKNLPRPLVGVRWKGSGTHPADAIRSLTLDELLEHVPLGRGGGPPARGSLISLQQEPLTAEQRTFITDVSAELVDWTETAALLANLDQVISADTAVLHLAGALGRPVKLVTRPDLLEWRWRTGCRWYESLTFA